MIQILPPDRLPIRARGALLPVWLVLAMSVCTAQAQETELPDPVDRELETKDGVVLKATFYPGAATQEEEKKDTVPIILLHGFRGQRGEFHELAEMLQEMGHAVLVPDLRGHGESTTVLGTDRDLEADRMPRQMFERMIADDMETLKRFLMDKNNKGELNIEKLCVVGSEMGAVVAAHWAAQDWSWPRLATGKQGQDVKALVLISPSQQIKGLQIDDAFNDQAVRSELSISLIMGEDDRRRASFVKRIFNRLRRYHRQGEDDPIEDKELFMDAFPTSLQGTKLLGETFNVGENTVGVNALIATFIKLRLVDQAYPWKQRKAAI